tara:strand:+ start:1953 stop:2210 length:258 start_codon:yes stop_codon:yes gene_type:complete
MQLLLVLGTCLYVRALPEHEQQCGNATCWMVMYCCLFCATHTVDDVATSNEYLFTTYRSLDRSVPVNMCLSQQSDIQVTKEKKNQ